MTSNITVLLDVDGVVADFIKGLEDALGVKFTKDQEYSRSPWKYCGPDVERRAIKILDDSSFWESLPLMEGARDGVTYLESKGCTIYWVTSPWLTCKGWCDARYRWLGVHIGADSRGRLFIPTPSKWLVPGDIIIDDYPKNLVEWKQRHPNGITLLYRDEPDPAHPYLDAVTWSSIQSYI